MPYVVIYDITKDSLRTRVADKLKDYGLSRIQYSAFVGDLRARSLRSLVIDLKRLIGKAGREKEERRLVHIFPVPFSSLESVIVIGEPKEGKKEEKRAKVF